MSHRAEELPHGPSATRNRCNRRLPKAAPRFREKRPAPERLAELFGFGERVTTRPASAIDAEVGDDAVEPGEKGRLALKSRESFERAQESFLHDLASVVVVAHQRNRHRESATRGTPDQTPARGNIPPLRQLDEGAIVRGLLGSFVRRVGRPAA
jgi:hypothetical protein